MIVTVNSAPKKAGRISIRLSVDSIDISGSLLRPDLAVGDIVSVAGYSAVVVSWSRGTSWVSFSALSDRVAPAVVDHTTPAMIAQLPSRMRFGLDATMDAGHTLDGAITIKTVTHSINPNGGTTEVTY